MAMKLQDDPIRFFNKFKIDPNTECWLWIGGKTRGNYGVFHRKLNNKWQATRAHRYSYEYHNGVSRLDIKDLFICHTCDTPDCVNPKHLFLGTCQDNTQDKIDKGRHKWGNTRDHRLLNLNIANDIRKYKQDNFAASYENIANVFSTSVPQVCRILNNKIWRI